MEISNSRRWFGRKFTRCTDGSSSIEYALILALVVGGLFFAGDMLGAVVSDSFETAAAGTTGEANKLSRPIPAKEPAEPESTAPETGDWSKQLTFTGSGLVTLAGGLVLLCLLRSQRKPIELETVSTTVGKQIEQESPVIFAKRQHVFDVLSTNMAALAAGNLDVCHLMTTNLVSVPPHMTVDQVAELKRDNQLRHMLVSHEGSLLGIISDRDLSRRHGKTAAEVMTRNPISVESKTPIIPVITLMIQRSFSALPVVDNGKLAGIITSTDLMLALQCTLQMMQRAQTNTRKKPSKN